ncbi:DUF4395 domain-containing protein [Metabacillus iocasae]|uniref:Membrane protein SpoIIM required for sporulation n=1 Tax=Priestia iocasae TaxID=2291674 RepID=A0ABS2QRG9_9BACI|nr:DUF4395 domain-containing protein [Metabacillus iocasae]MBM7702039.1 putative membrane protein SpoIIM required for sporulation [Metabacillus iocasae]
MSIPKPLVQLNQWFIVVTTVLGLVGSFYVLILPIVIGVVTVTTKKNPIMLVGKTFLRRPLQSYLQEDRDQQLFNQWIATSLLSVAFICFVMGWTIVGTIFSVMVITAAGVALMGYCIGCTVRYRYTMWKYKKTQKQNAA